MMTEKMTEKKIQILSKPSEVQAIASEWKKSGLSIGLVPTMGYLHDGHRSLIHRACAENDRVIVSIFVNPIQFGPNEDLATYPRDLEADSALCEEEGVDIIFHPEPEDMYRTAFFHPCSGGKNHGDTLRRIETYALPGCDDRRQQAVPYLQSGQSLFRRKRRSAAGRHPPDDRGSQHGH